MIERTGYSSGIHRSLMKQRELEIIGSGGYDVTMSSADERPDVCDRSQLAELVRRFYGDVAQDELLGPMFNDVAKVDWSEHLPKLTDFWARVLFGTPGYAGNPFRAHLDVHRQVPFTIAHFNRWLELFHETIDLGWAGPNADHMKAMANNVARVHAGQLVGESIDSAYEGVPA